MACKRCGQCCYLQDKEGKPGLKKCRYLIILKSGLTLCRVYNQRLGKDIGHGNKCTYRENLRVGFKDCPYNKEGQPVYEIDIRTGVVKCFGKQKKN